MRSIEAKRTQAHPHPTPERFSGPVFIQELNETGDATGLEVLAVFFDAGARTLPHTHSTEQLLYFVEGEGIVATETERHLYRPGGMALVPPGEWHWHGATPSSAMRHLSIRPGGPSAWPPDVPMRDWDTYMTGAVEDP